MKKIMKNKKATSLIEVMIGVILLALIMIPSLNVIIGQTKTVNATRDHSQATFIANRMLEIAKAWDFKMLDRETYKRFYKDDSTKTEQQTFEYQLQDSNANSYNTYDFNGTTYKIINANIEAILKIEETNTSEALPILYSLRYSIEIKGPDGKINTLGDFYTVLAKR